VAVREEGLTLVADGLVPPRGMAGPVLPLLLGFTVGGFLLVTWLTFRMCGPGATRRRVRVVFWSGLGLLLALHLAGYGLLMAGRARPWVVEGLVTGLAGRLGALGPAGWVGAWLAVVLVAALGWRLSAQAFLRVEAVRTTGSCSM
jgi:hypothetical protein